MLYLEGRQLWTDIQIASRNLATLIWVHVPMDRATDANDTNANTGLTGQVAVVIEKKSMINLVCVSKGITPSCSS